MKLNLKGIVNARELGGLVMKDGRTVKHGLLLRGASLNKAEESDIRCLSEEYGVKMIFDFRTEQEVKHAPDRDIPGAKYLWLPTLDPANGEKGKDVFSAGGFHSAEELVLKASFLPAVQEAARNMYTDIVDNEYSQLQYAVFLQKIIAAEGGAIYWHCSQGKDRTGLGAAFILAALGADRETILADYMISNEVYEEEVRQMKEIIRNEGGGDAEMDVVQTFIGVNIQHFLEGLHLIDHKYGGMDSYLRYTLLLSDEDRVRLQDLYLGRSQDSGF